METKFIELTKDFLPLPEISEEELKKYPLYGFNCCGEVVEFPNLRGD